MYVDLVDAGSHLGHQATGPQRPLLGDAVGAAQAPTGQRGRDPQGRASSSTSTATSTSTPPRARSASPSPRSTSQGLLGDVARRRQELIARLRAEGLLDANKAAHGRAVPLRVGLVASPGTEGYSDFTGQLLHSGYGFAITLVKTAVQGEAAPQQIVPRDRRPRRARRGHHLRRARRGLQGRPRVLRRRTRRARHRLVHDAGLHRHRPHRRRVGRGPRRAHLARSRRPSWARRSRPSSSSGTAATCAYRPRGCSTPPSTWSTRRRNTWPNADER